MEITEGKIKWIDIINPTKEDLAWLKTNYNLHEVILKELEIPSARERVERYDDYLYFVYYFPDYDLNESTSKTAEIDFVITKDALITVHYQPVQALKEFKKREFNSTFDLSYQILETLTDFQERQLTHVREKVEEAGRKLFKDKEYEVLQLISRVKRDLSEYRIIIRRQGLILKSFVEYGTEFFGEKSKIYLQDLLGDHLKIAHKLEDYREAVSDFEDTNNQLMNAKMMGVTRTFTILAFLTFPMMLFAALFSMNTVNTPLVGNPYSFWIIVGVMIVLMSSMYTYFKSKDWL